MTNKRKKRNQQNMTAYVISFCLVVVFTGFGYAVIEQSKFSIPNDNHCFEDEINAATMVFFDASIDLNDRVKRDIKAIFFNLYENLAFNEKLVLLTTETDQVSSIPDERLVLCRPAKTASELESIGADSDITSVYLKKEMEKLYKARIMPIVADLIEQKNVQGSESPILEYIQSISRRPDFSENLAARRLVLISDLIQNRHPVRFCEKKNNLPRFRNFKKNKHFLRIKPNPLNNVEVHIFMAVLDGYYENRYCTENELHNFYTDYFKDSGVSKVTIQRLLF